MKLFRYLRLWYRANLKGICPRCNGKTYWLPSEYERCSECAWNEFEDGFWRELK